MITAQQQHPTGPDPRRQAKALVFVMSKCIRHLDELNEGIAAAHLSMAIEVLKRHHRLDEQG